MRRHHHLTTVVFWFLFVVVLWGCGDTREGSGLCLYYRECIGEVLWCYDYNGYVSWQEKCPCGCQKGQCDICLSDAPIGGILPGTFSTDGGTFKVSVTPVDENGELLHEGLTVENFSFHELFVYELTAGGIPVSGATAWPVELAVNLPNHREDASTSVALLLDSSGSMSGSDPGFLRVDAATLLLEHLRDRDRVAVLDFGAGSTEGQECIRVLQDFTNDEDDLLSALDKITDDGGTPLYCASLEALDLLSGESSEERILLLLTDGESGEDNEEDLLEEAKDLANQEEMVVYTVGLGYSVEFEYLQEFAQETGGTFGLVDDPQVLAGIFQAIGIASSQGWIVVHGQGDFDTQLDAGAYLVKGLLRTTMGEVSIDTPFQFGITLQ